MLSTRKDLENALATNKPIKFTIGFKYKHPTTYEIPIDKESALEFADEYSFYDVEDKGDWIDFNVYTSNDMY